MGRPSLSSVLMLCLLAGLCALFLLRLGADPPAALDVSGGAFADEGPWLHNARNLLLYGTLRTDGWNPWLLSPLTHLQGLAAMSVLGVGLAPARVSALVVFVGILLALRAWPADRKVGTLALLLLGTNLVAVQFGRVVLVDNMVLLLAVATAAVLCAGLRAQREGARLALLAFAGLLGALCLITKILVVFLVPAWAGAVLVDARARRRPPGRVLLDLAVLGGALAAAWAAYTVLVRWPHAEDLEVYLGFYREQQGLTPLSVAQNIISQRLFAYFSWTPVLLVLLVWVAYDRLGELWRRRALPPADEALALLWLLGGTALLSMLRYRPMRYYLVLLPPAALLVAGRLARLLDGGALGTPRPAAGLRLLALVPAATAVGLLAEGALFDFAHLEELRGWMGLSPVRLGALALCALAVATAPHALGRVAGRRGAAALLAAYLALDLGGILAWAVHPETTIRDSSADLSRRLPSDAVVTGQFAIQLTFDTPHLRAVPVWCGYYNAERPFERYGITHLLLWTYNRRMEIRNFEQCYPHVMERARLLHRYWIKRSDVLLYEVPNPASVPGASAGSGRHAASPARGGPSPVGR